MGGLTAYTYKYNWNYKGKQTLISVILPLTATTIGDYAFWRCIGLTNIIIPNSVTLIGGSAFSECSGLTSINIPSSVTSIGSSAFAICNSLTSINIPSSVTSIGGGAFEKCKGLTSMIIPASVNFIGSFAFNGCTGLTSINIPSSVNFIGSSAFSSCTGLTSIYVNSSPIELSSSSTVFGSVNKATCTLYVPYKAKVLYAAADQWKDFINIVESTQGFLLSSNYVKLPSNAGSSTLNITANVQWTVGSDQSWLTVSPSSGIGDDTFTLTFQTNSTNIIRTAKVFVSANGITSQIISVSQIGVAKSINITAGSLSTALTSTELDGIVDLTITGTIDARDFKTLRDNIPHLAKLDLSKVIIVAYTGTEGTLNNNISYTYPENTLPNYAFYSPFTGINKVSLTSVIIPSSATSVGQQAFYSCTSLTSIYANSCPIDLSSSSAVFGSVNKAICTLYVPYKAKVLYAAANQWKDFTNIVENTQGFLLSSNYVKLPSTAGNTTLNITSNVKWTVGSDQTWLTVSHSSGIGDDTFTLTFQTNSSNIIRTAKVFVSANGITSQVISVSQIGVAKSIDISAGTLATALTSTELDGIVDLTITGIIDARDFKTMRDNMPHLAKLDLSKVTIVAYTGTEGTNNGSHTYPENTLPDYAFNSPSGINKVLTSVIIPSSVTSIGYSAFGACTGLTSINIPSSVTSIGSSAFNGCTALTSIYVNCTVPVDLSLTSYVFSSVNKTTCTLYVPKGSKSAYQAAVQWKDFINIIEMNLALSTNTVKMAVNGNSVSVSVTSNTTWTVSSEQIWLTVNTSSGIGDNTFTLSAQANPTAVIRTAIVTVSSTGITSQTITITQGGWCAKSITVKAGGLSTSLTSSELAETTNLTLSGTIDARDFKTMRDNMPHLEKLDLSGVNVLAYAGTEGTDIAGASKTYQANLIPQNAFYNANTNTGKISLISVLMPSSVTSIGNFAFYFCNGLANINITSAISSLGSFSFGNCAGLNEINVESGNSNYSAIDGVLFDKNRTKLIQYPNNKQCNNYIVPSSVTSIEEFAFYFCSGLKSITIPNTVTSIGKFAFANCSGLKSIYAYSTTPVDLNSSIYVFSGIEDICTLYVPKESVSAYQAAYQWKDFTNIIEMTTSDLSINTIENLNLYPNPVTDAFQISGIVGLVTFRLVDINGRLLLTKQVTDNEFVSISSLSKGLYIVKLITAEGTVERKMIKK